MTQPQPPSDPSITDGDGKVVVTAWTADTIASHIMTQKVSSNTELLLLGILLQNGATATLPANYTGNVYVV